MTRMGKHWEESITAAPPRRDHLWVLVIVAACALLEVWASWVTIGAMSGFPKIGHLPTDWTLAVTTELYWGYALYAWLATAPGPRSRRFAMWSAAAVFTLSLTGQGAAHLVAPGTKPSPVLVVFVTALPVIVLALIAVLVHLRQVDREEVAEVAEESALRAELRSAHAAREAAEAERQAAEAALGDAQREAAEATAKAEALTRKLAASAGAKRGRNAGRRNPATAGRRKGAEDPATRVPKDVNARAEALGILDTEPGISGAKLGDRVGMSERWGQLFKSEMVRAAPQGPDSKEAS
jgi:hypothetical protein